jgi:hypothetical protein
MPTRLQNAVPKIREVLDAADAKVFSQKDLARLLAENEVRWQLKRETTVHEFLEVLLQNGLTSHTFRSDHYSPITRYSWGEISSFQMGVALRPNSYLSHGTAVFLHGLTDQFPAVIYSNQEQSPKPQFSRSSLTQEALDRAFKNRQRQSSYVFKGKRGWRFVLLNGKQTNRLEVAPVVGPIGEEVDVTTVERTLIDIVVRPSYAGGIYEVRQAFEAARSRVSTDRLLSTLRRLDYVYPYHQAIGFYMERTGYPAEALDRVAELGIDFNFYIAHGTDNRAFDSRWRLFFPEGF